MLDTQLINLDESSELNQVMCQRPTMLAHGTLLTLLGFVGTSVVWLASSTACLVVVAPGVVRPLQETYPVVAGEKFSANTGSRIVQVGFVQGQRVAKGDILVCLDTTWIDHEIAVWKKENQNRAAELLRLAELDRKIQQEFAGKQIEAETLLSQAQRRLSHAKDRREQQIDLAQVEVSTSQDQLRRLRLLLDRNAVSKSVFANAQSAAEQAVARLQLAKLPVDASDLAVLEQRRQQVKQQEQVQAERLASQRLAKQDEIEKAKLTLTRLKLEREQARIVAPVGGVIITPAPKTGDVIAAGKLIAEIASGTDLRLDVVIPTKDVGHLHEGMPARIKLNAFDYQTYGTMSGKVSFISPDSNVTNDEPGQASPPSFLAHIKLEQCDLGSGRHAGVAKIGMTGIAEIATERKTLMSLLTSKIDRFVRID